MIMSKGSSINPKSTSSNLHESGSELRRGPWTLEEDNLLIQYINCHGGGRWSSLAKCAGLKRTGKSCRLRWLNYLKPDIKRGNLTPHEQLLILELHSKWGNRWSRIAQHLPGRTDNEIKNYWRTRVQKQARQLKIDSNSKKFVEAIRTFWMPRLIEKMGQNSSSTSSPSSSSISTLESPKPAVPKHAPDLPSPCPNTTTTTNVVIHNDSDSKNLNLPSALSSAKIDQCENYTVNVEDDHYYYVGYGMQELESQDVSLHGCHVGGVDWLGEELGSGSFWDSTDELWQFRKYEESDGT